MGFGCCGDELPHSVIAKSEHDMNEAFKFVGCSLVSVHYRVNRVENCRNYSLLIAGALATLLLLLPLLPTSTTTTNVTITIIINTIIICSLYKV